MFVKILKKLLSWIVTLILMLTLSVTTLLFITKQLITIDTITEIINTTSNTVLNETISEVNDKYNTDFDEDADINELIPEELKEYIDDKEINDFIQEYFNQLIEYEIGIGSAPKINKDKLTTIIDKGLEKASSETTEKFNYDELYEQIDELDKTVEEELKPIENNNIKTAIKIYYQNTYLYIGIAIIIVCILLLFIINRSIISTLKYIGTSILINGVSAIGISYLLKEITNSFEIFSSLSDIALKPFRIFGIIYIIIGILLLIISLIIKIIKKKMSEKKDGIKVVEQEEVKIVEEKEEKQIQENSTIEEEIQEDEKKNDN